jgi:hypothetical protein
MPRASSWYAPPWLWLELFVLVNLGFLAPDIYLAHSFNSFRHEAEYIPLIFSLAAPVVLLVALAALAFGAMRVWRGLGLLVGATAVAIGVAGLLWHLGSRFFERQTLESLVYTAPFAAPLAYSGIGLLAIMNRMVDAQSPEWPRWVLLLALGGFVGNFIFSVADHAQNGFFHAAEWIPVASSAFAVTFLLVPFLMEVGPAYLLACLVVLLAQMPIGLLGFYYHNMANLEGTAPRFFDNTVFGAPPMAPLLLPNLVLLALIGLWPLFRLGSTATTNHLAGDGIATEAHG